MVLYILVNDKQPVKVGTKLAEWDPTSKVLLTEKSGTIQFIDLIENVTFKNDLMKPQVITKLCAVRT